MGRLQTWYGHLAEFPVNWICEWNMSGPGFIRKVVMTVMIDGRDRPLEVRMTPNEARVLARRLNQQADAIDRSNAAHDSGWVTEE